jgi:hypothetical protein
MKKFVYSAGALFVATTATAGRLSDMAQAIHFTPPTNFYGGVITHPRTDPGDNPLSLTSPAFLQYTDKRGGFANLSFHLSLIGAFVGEGKVIHYQQVTPALMAKEIEAEYKDRLSNTTPAVVENLQGLTSVNLTVTRPQVQPTFLRFCWVQVETNVAIKISAIASDARSFSTITNSLRTLAIDKARFLAAVYAKPKDADIITNLLQRVELGHKPGKGREPGVCVFYTKTKTYSLNVGETSNPADDLKSSMDAFGRLRDLSAVRNALRVVVIDIAPDIPQTSLLVAAETNAPARGTLWLKEIRSANVYFPMAPITLAWDFKEGPAPQGFRKEVEYKMNATLIVRTNPTAED